MYAELKTAIIQGIISLSDTEEMIAMIERKEYLEKHYDELPCSKDYFYDRYRKFFFLLDKVRENI